MLLILSILAVLVGPGLFWLVEKNTKLVDVIDGLIFISISGLVLMHVLPAVSGDGGGWILVFALIGFLGPNLLEGNLHRGGQNIHLGVLVLGVLGFAFHGALDGAALAVGHDHMHGDESINLLTDIQISALPVAIVLHRIPVGLTLWYLLKPSLGRTTAWTAIIFLCLTTAAGYFGTDAVSAMFSYLWLGIVQALAAGAILHVVVFRFHLDSDHSTSHSGGNVPEDSCCHTLTYDSAQKDAQKDDKKWKIAPESIGNIIGALIILFIGFWHSVPGENGNVASAFVSLFSQTAPALLLAYIFSGLLFAFIPQGSIAWLSKGSRVTQLFKGLTVGLPLPICSCGVLPLYRTLVARGAPSAAALAFLLATPELGIDAVLISIPLLGEEVTIIRVMAVILFTICMALLIAPLVPENETEHVTNEEQLSIGQRLKAGGYYGLVELVQSTGPWILAGLLVAAIAEPLLGDDLLSLPFAMEVLICSVAGIVMYVCAAGSTPFIAVLLAHGLSPGAGIAFLLTGPATNISTFGVLRELHGRKVALVFCVSATLLAVAIGYGVEILYGSSFSLPDLELAHHQHVPWYQTGSMIAVSLLFIFAMLKNGARSFFGHVVGKMAHSH